MARPTKSTVEYFPHYITGGKTLFILENEFGNDGYAFWFKLLEVLGGTEGMMFRYDHPANRRFLLSKTKVDEEKCLRIIETLVDLEAIDRELWQCSHVIWCQNLVENVRDAFKKRISAIPQKPEISVSSPLNKPIAVVSAPETPGNELFPVEETGKGKERESKEKEKEKINNASPSRNEKTAHSDSVFEKFYQIYPRKTGKQAASKAWTKLMKDPTFNPDRVIEQTYNFAETHRLLQTETRYILHPSTFLNQKRFDEYPVVNPEGLVTQKKLSKFEKNKLLLGRMLREDEDDQGGDDQALSDLFHSLPDGRTV